MRVLPNLRSWLRRDAAFRWDDSETLAQAHGIRWEQAGRVFADPYRADPREHCPGKLGPSWRNPR